MVTPGGKSITQPTSIDSAALRFIPAGRLEEFGYGWYSHLF
ncbi:MAG: hypothetical protein ACTSU5_09170 [Promethearchaeota archaeon]